MDNSNIDTNDIAIIGISCKVSEASNTSELWNNLMDGKESIRNFPDGRREELLKINETFSKRRFIKAGYLDKIFQFEPELFGISHEECKYIDPQHRLLLELVEEAILDSGYSPESLSGTSTGVFVSENPINYIERVCKNSPFTLINSVTDSNSGRIAYTYNFNGPALAIGTACSSSLVAIHYACESLKNKESSLAIAGGVELNVFPIELKEDEEKLVMSEKQKICAFDEEANGTVAGEGGGIVILKLLKNAIRDNDHIYSVIKGSAVNSNGRRSNGLAAPSKKGQADVIMQSVNKSNLNGLKISYLEAHGTGTKIGDPIEVSGMNEAFNKLNYLKQSVAIGSIKPNIGHLNGAAGVIGLIKVILMLKNRILPKSLNFSNPNKLINFQDTCVYVNNNNNNWDGDDIKVASVTSLGLTGTNCNVIIQEYERDKKESFNNKNIFIISARTPYSLYNYIKLLYKNIKHMRHFNSDDVSFTLNTGRRKLKYIYMFTANDKDTVLKKLKNYIYENTENTFRLGNLSINQSANIAEKKVEGKSLMIFPDFKECNFLGIEKLINEIPLFKNIYNETLNKLNYLDFLGNDKVQYLLYIYSYYRFLKEININTKIILGIGAGNIIADLVINKITLSKAINLIKEYDFISNNNKNDKLIDKINTLDVKSVIVVLPSLNFSNMFKKMNKNISLIEYKYQLDEFYLSVINSICVGSEINWQNFYNGSNRCKLKLPTYCFKRNHYFIDDGDIKNGVFDIYYENIKLNNKKEIIEKIIEKDNVSKVVIDILKEISNIDNITEDSVISDLVLDSLSIMQIKVKLKKKFNKDIPLSLLFTDFKVKELIDKLRSEFDNSILIKSEKKNINSNNNVFPMSYSQQRLFILNQMVDNKKIYNMTQVFDVSGNLDIRKLENSFLKLINRHEILRTSFSLVNGSLVQIIHNDANFKLEYIESNNASETIQNFSQKFDLTKTPLLKIFVVKTGDKAYKILFNIHHIIFDGFSTEIMLRDLIELYNGKNLEELHYQYKHFAIWQQKMIESPIMNDKKEFWLKMFSGELPLLNMPLDYKRNSKQSFDGGIVTLDVNKEIANELHMFVEKHNVTLYMLMISAYAILLSHYSNQDDIIIGTPVSGRNQEESYDLIGMFVNTIALRFRPMKNQSIIEFINEVKEISVQGFENQDYPFDKLVDMLGVKRDITRNPLFDTMFALQNVGCNKSKIRFAEDIEIFQDRYHTGLSKFDIFVNVYEMDGVMKLEIEYAKKLFMKESIEKLGLNYIYLIKRMLENPYEKIDDIFAFKVQKKDLMDESRLIQNKTIIEIFEEKAKVYKDKIAVEMDDINLTFSELNLRANKVARKLMEYGVVEGKVIGILSGRSIDLIINILGVLKIKAAFLPITKSLPVNRIQYMLNDSDVDILINDSEIELSDYNGKVVSLKSIDLSNKDEDNLNFKYDMNDIAYVIYTSGSTGNPKGVLIKHVGLTNLLEYMQTEYPCNDGDSYLFKTAHTFDVSMTEIFGWIMGGGKLVISRDGTERDPKEIANILKQKNITHINFVPSMLNSMISYLEISKENSFNNLKYIFTAGEAINYDLVKKVNNIIDDTLFVNLYGPTEATIYVTAYILNNINEKVSVPIGKAISNIKILILDDKLRHIKDGFYGEICISGIGLAKGYQKKERITSEKFVYLPELDSKVYRTGDLGRILPSGDIEFKGRIDNQVKIKGFRIELGEIEFCILKFKKIKNTVVTYNNSDKNTYLCCYIVSDDKVDTEELKIFLSGQLPYYMIPNYYIQVNEIPLNSSGKVDRKYLPLPNKIQVKNEKRVEPTNKVEKIIADIWKEILEVQNISINDNFFELGGDSLKAVKVMLGLMKNYEITINDIFDFPTIKLLSQKVGRNLYQINEKIEALKEIKFSTMHLKEKDLYNSEVKELLGKYTDMNDKYKDKNLQIINAYKNILLVGGSGYLGIHLLKTILEKSDYNIYLLLRGNSKEQIKRRLKDISERTLLYDVVEKYNNRIFIIQGDLQKDKFGLSEDSYYKLSNVIDCIFNCAANVKHYGKYEDFYNVNVLGAKRLLDFALTNNKKSYNYISTTSVGSGSIEGKHYALFTEYDFDIGQTIESYYINSKKEAEKIILEYREKGLICNIFRVGNLVFDSKSGVFQQNINDNAFYNLMRTFIMMRAIPNFNREIFDFTYVDYASEAIFLLHNRRELENENHHIINSKKISFIELKQLLDNLDYKVELYNIDEFITFLNQARLDDSKREVVEKFLIYSHVLESINQTNVFIESEKTKNILKMLDFEWPSIEVKKLGKMLKFCKKVNFI